MIPTPAATVLRALMLADVDTPLERCGEGLRWLRDRGHLYERSSYPVPLVSERGLALAREIRIGDA